MNLNFIKTIALKLETTVLVVIFITVSTKFFKHFGRGKYDDILDILAKRKGLDCPVGIELFRLQDVKNSKMYHVQIQKKPLDKNKVMYRRCQIFSMLSHVNVSREMEQRYRTDFVEYITEEESMIINQTCIEQNYTTRAYSGIYTDKDDTRGITNTFVNYWLEVVKGPPFEQLPVDPEPDDWGLRTLLSGIFPGTLWCGFENIADDHYQNLGFHHQTDSCCRLHDICKPRVKAFQTRFFLNNPTFIPVSHCSCDMEFYKCLKTTDSPTSNKIGHIFFNLAKINCFDFDLKEVCTWNFLGICWRREKRCAAVLRDNPAY